MSDHHISLHENVFCYELNDQGKVFLDKQASAFVDFTHIPDAVSKEDVAQCKTAANVSENTSYLPFFTSSLTSFSNNAFEDEKIQQKTFFPESVQHIGNSSFRSCTELKHLSLPNTLSIDDNAFADNQLEDVKIGNTIKKIGSNSFYSSDQTLTSFTADVLSSSLDDAEQCWPFGIADDSVIHFNKEAEEIVIPPVPNNSKLEVAENVVKHDLHDEGQTYSDDTKLATLDLTYFEGELNAEDIDLPAEVAEGNVPFVAYFNDNLTAIGAETFIESNITWKTVFPDSLMSIGNGAFYGCKQLDLEDVYLHTLCVDVEAFSESNIKSLAFDKVQHIGNNVFLSCENLSTITFSNRIHDIGENAFAYSTHLSIVFEDDVLEALSTTANYPWGLQKDKIFTPLGRQFVKTLTFSDLHLTRNAIHQLTLHYSGTLLSIDILSSCTAIDEDAFVDCTSIEAVNFVDRAKDVVKKLDGYPWNLSSKQIKCLYVPTGVMHIADDVKLVRLNDDNSTLYCNDSMPFKYLDLTHLDYVSDQTVIQKEANAQGISLDQPFRAYLSDKCQAINVGGIAQAFFNTAVTDIEVPKSVELINPVVENMVPYKQNDYLFGPFMKCTQLSGFSVEDGNDWYSSNGKSVLVDKYRNSIIRGMATDALPDDVSSIDDYGFIGQLSSTKLVIPQSVQHIGYKAFCNLNETTPIDSYSDNHTSVNDSLSLSFEGRSMNDVVQMEFYPWNVNKSHISAEYSNKVTYTVITARSVYSIPDEEVVILSSGGAVSALQTIYPNAASGLKKLRNLVIINDVNSVYLSTDCIHDCNALQKITCSSTKYVRFYLNAVHDCSSLEEVWCMKLLAYDQIHWSNGINADMFFNNCPKLRLVHSRYIGTAANYNISMPNCNFARYSDIQTVDDSMLLQYRDGYDDIGHLRYVTPTTTVLRDSLDHDKLLMSSAGFSVETVEAKAAKNRINLTAVQFDDAFKLMDESFYGCSSLQSAILPKVTDIRQNAFNGCSSLSVYEFGDITSIYSNAFNGTPIVNDSESTMVFLNDEKVLLKAKDVVDQLSNDNVKTVAVNAFDDSHYASKLILNNCQDINASAFVNSRLKHIEIPNIKSIGAYAFASTYVTNVNVSALTSIPAYAFSDSSIQTLNVDSLSNIKTNQFANCKSLTSLSLPSVIRMGSQQDILSNCTLQSLKMENLQYIYGRSFRGLIVTDIQLPKLSCAMYHAFDGLSTNQLNLSSLTEVGAYAFQNACMKSVYIPNVSSLSQACFANCTQLTSIDMTNILSIDAYALSGCIGLTAMPQVDVPNVSSVQNYAFKNSGIRSFKSTYATAFGYECFAGCTYLTGIHSECSANNSSASFTKGALSGCTSLVCVDVPDGASIYECALAGCTALKSTGLPKLYSVNSYALSGCMNVTSVDTSRMRYVSDYAFAYSGLTSFTVNYNMLNPRYGRFKNTAFYGCSNMKSIIAPKSVESLGYTNTLCDVTYENVLFKDNEIFIALGSLDQIPDGISLIDESQLTAFTNIQNVVIPATLTGDLYHLSGFYNVQHISVHPDNPVYTSLNGCDGIVLRETGELLAGCVNTKMQPGIKSIASSAFRGRYVDVLNFTKRDASDLLSIQFGAFSGCLGINTLNVDRDDISVNTNAFTNCGHITVANVSSDAVPYAMLYNSVHLNILSATTIDKNAFSGCISLQSVALDSATQIGDDAFASCSALTSIYVPQLTSIGNKAFQLCYSLRSIDISQIDDASHIGYYAFCGCYNIRNAYLSPALTAIPEAMFANCYKLTAICKDSEMLTSLKAVLPMAFMECSSLTFESIEFGQISSVGINAFAGCEQLQHVTLTSLNTLDAYAFERCSSLKDVHLGNPDSSLNRISDYAFNACTSLSSIVIEHDVSNKLTVSYDAFVRCEQLLCVDFSDTNLVRVYAHAFANCTHLKDVILPSSLTSLNDMTFNEVVESDSGIQYWNTRCPMLSNLHFMGKSYAEAIKTCSGRAQHPLPYWGIDSKMIQLDQKYMSKLNISNNSKCIDLNDGGIAYSSEKILDLTQKA